MGMSISDYSCKGFGPNHPQASQISTLNFNTNKSCAEDCLCTWETYLTPRSGVHSSGCLHCSKEKAYEPVYLTCNGSFLHEGCYNLTVSWGHPQHGVAMINHCAMSSSINLHLPNCKTVSEGAGGNLHHAGSKIHACHIMRHEKKPKSEFHDASAPSCIYHPSLAAG